MKAHTKTTLYDIAANVAVYTIVAIGALQIITGAIRWSVIWAVRATEAI